MAMLSQMLGPGVQQGSPLEKLFAPTPPSNAAPAPSPGAAAGGAMAPAGPAVAGPAAAGMGGAGGMAGNSMQAMIASIVAKLKAGQPVTPQEVQLLQKITGAQVSDAGPAGGMAGGMGQSMRPSTGGGGGY